MKFMILLLIGSLLLSGCTDANAEQPLVYKEPETVSKFIPLETSWLENTLGENAEWKRRLPENKDVTLQSFYGEVSVKNFDGARVLYISDSMMGQINIENPIDIREGWRYIDCFGNAFTINPDIKSVLVLGVGVGLFPTKASIKQNVYIDAVDINDKVLELAKEHFGLQETKNSVLHTEDARVFLNNTNKKYDLIVVDVYKSDEGMHKIPFNLITQEFFQLTKEHLNEGGIFTAMFLTGDELITSDFYNLEYKTVSSVYKNNYMLNCGMQVIFSSDSELSFEGELVGKLYSVEPKEGSIIFTDDFAPVNIFEEVG